MKKNHKVKRIFFCFFLLFFMNLPVQAAESEKEIVTERKITISSKREFLEFAENCRFDKFSEKLVVSLEADIDLTGNEFEGVPIFCGMFEGNHHTISGLNISDDGSAKGLFRYLQKEAVVKNLSVKGKVIPQGSKSILGGLAGKNAGLIMNCSFSGEMDGKDYVGGIAGINEVTGTIDNCQMEGTVLGIHFVGGICGENRGVIRNCSNQAKINTEAQKSNLELSDITIESLTSSEATYTVTDVGGIAGSSSGVIKNCKNQGDVGYQHIGYNVGGIAGSQVGYVSWCENFAPVLGRKEVGGIVGQMQPVADMEFSADTLQILEGQLGAATAAIQQSNDNIQAQIMGSSADINSQIGKLQKDLGNTTEAVNQLLTQPDTSSLNDIDQKIKELEKLEETQNPEEYSFDNIAKMIDEYRKKSVEVQNTEEEKKESPDGNLTAKEMREWYEQLKEWENLKLPDTDNVQAAQNSLNESMNSMNETLNSITQSGQDSMNAMTSEMQVILNQAKSITSTVANATDYLGISLTDVSDEDTEDNFIAKIEDCKNTGKVQADLNGGGIVGVIAIENDLDPEGELEISGEASLNLQGELRAVVLRCDNEANVAVRNQNAGGIAGWVFLGLIKDCINTGTIEAQNADYVGGITGISTGYIRNNSAKCEISGNSYVGGIAGSANMASECYSMVWLNSGNEKIGNILGNLQENYRNEEEPVKDNYYLWIEQDYGGIDGISYFKIAEPLERNEFFKLENLPEEFWKVKVTFIHEDNSYEQIFLNHGGSLAVEDIPEVPWKEGYVGVWEGLESADTSEIFFDISFKAAYTPVKGTIPCKTKGEQEKPILLLQGSFRTTQEVAMTELNDLPEELEDADVVDAFGFELKENEAATEARYLMKEGQKGENLRVYLSSPEISWHETESTVDGSYLVFPLKNGENRIVITENKKAVSLWGGVAAMVLVVFGIAIVLEKKQRM